MKKALITSLVMAFASFTHAELVPVDDQELATYSGQAIIGIDQYQVNQGASESDFLRVTLGATIETNATIDKVQLGTYDRAGSTASSDIDIDNLRLGYIDPTSKEYVPFVIENPYVEFAFSDTAGVSDVVGLRIGAGGASGSFTANINSLTGNFELLIDHDGDAGTAGIPAQLLDSTGAATNIRATHLGVAGGNCATNTNCVAMDNLASFNINDAAASGDMFLSYQNIDMKWAKTLNDGTIVPVDLMDSSTFIEAAQGAFINLPTGATTTTDALIGVPGAGGNINPTRYTDAALGLF